MDGRKKGRTRSRFYYAMFILLVAVIRTLTVILSWNCRRMIMIITIIIIIITTTARNTNMATSLTRSSSAKRNRVAVKRKLASRSAKWVRIFLRSCHVVVRLWCSSVFLDEGQLRSYDEWRLYRGCGSGLFCARESWHDSRSPIRGSVSAMNYLVVEVVASFTDRVSLLASVSDSQCCQTKMKQCDALSRVGNDCVITCMLPRFTGELFVCLLVVLCSSDAALIASHDRFLGCKRFTSWTHTYVLSVTCCNLLTRARGLNHPSFKLKPKQFGSVLCADQIAR